MVMTPVALISDAILWPISGLQCCDVAPAQLGWKEEVQTENIVELS